MSFFEFDPRKNSLNQTKHGVSFEEAQQAFADAQRVILEDATHSLAEKRYFCLGKVNDNVMTVRFTLRGSVIRIFGAAYWRKGKKIYEQENHL